MIADINELEKAQGELQIVIENQQKLKETLNEMISGVNISDKYFKVLMNGSFGDSSHLSLMLEASERLLLATKDHENSMMSSLRSIKEREAHCVRILDSFWTRFSEFVQTELTRIYQANSYSFKSKRDIPYFENCKMYYDKSLLKYSNLMQKLFENQPRLHRDVEEVCMLLVYCVF